MSFSLQCKRGSHVVQKLLTGSGLVRPAESKKCEEKHSASKLMPATAGSAGLDLAARESVTLMTSVHVVPIGVWGLLGNYMHAS